MPKKTPTKFQEKLELSYEQYLRNSYHETVNLAKELEQALGRETAFKIIAQASENSGIRDAKAQMAQRGPFKNLEEFKTFWKENLKSPYSGSTR